MNYIIKRTDTFVKTAQKFFKRHPELIDKFKDIITKMEENPFEVGLKTHKLKGNLKYKYGVSLNYTYRITIAIQEKEVILLDIGPHDAVY
ncbi:MAG: type II toxin-antitoxin system YafQ family toxin [Candidatus Omnitrophota bacterium]